MSQPTDTCKNCEKEFQEGFEFCPHCGQKTKDDLTLGVLFYNTIANYFSFDARFFKSFLPLMFKPGYLAARFIEGKRLLYLHPAQLYLFISVLFFFLFSFDVSQTAQKLDEGLAKTLERKTAVDTISDERVRDSIKQAKREQRHVKDSIGLAEAKNALMLNQKWTGMTETEIDSILSEDTFRVTTENDNLNLGDFNEEVIDSLIATGASDEEIYKSMGLNEDDGWLKRKFYKQGLKFYKNRRGGSVLQTFVNAIPIAMFFLLPLFAFIIKIFHYSKGRYAHHLVFSFYFFSFLFTVFSIIVGINLFKDIPDWIDWLVGLSTFFYLFLALKRFYQQHWFWSFFKASVVTFVFLLIVIPFTFGILAVFAVLFY